MVSSMKILLIKQQEYIKSQIQSYRNKNIEEEEKLLSRYYNLQSYFKQNIAADTK